MTTTYGSVWRTDSKQPCSSSVGGGRAVRGGGELGMCVGPTAEAAAACKPSSSAVKGVSENDGLKLPYAVVCVRHS